ncbi:type I-E CRISPR-associated protein Cse1/CasA [Streptomyces qinzhouensis]|uniref:Type I-E CRISPR-associated protein Cse1/CasA n=1 Tax=Streptomyces qinzhouensis TaxID=2599401 RepID=A0A5B8J6G8_9ACTN|nr:type I-E CRISPR-associated protein Cse1/CasA [Streptomyces qinzhouensis]QDY76806.1 type I-E CRISPR-associated protein Cse1/CasA [Streptomyces qinzhouensis]
MWDPRHRPCVPAVTVDGDIVELSLLEVLRRAEELDSLVCPTPGEGVAVLDYLLAICFAAGVFPRSDEEWHDWVSGEHGLDRAAEWLAHDHDGEWDLFHPERPLGQNSGLAPFLDAHGTGPAQLVLERVGDYSQFFDHHHLEHSEPLPAAEAFRAVLVQHVYGLSGRARLSGKATLGPRITNLAAGRLQGRIRVVVQGRTVGDTLRLNLYPPAHGRPGRFNHSWTSGDFPRRDFLTKPPGRTTSGPADLHSSLGRSILLRPAPVAAADEPAVVERVLIGAGELLALDPGRDLEDAVYTQRSLNGPAKPLWPSPTRALWREAHALYSAAREAETGLFGRLRDITFPRDGDGPPCVLWAVGLVADRTLAVTWTDGYFPYAPSQGEALCRASRRGSAIAEWVARALERAAYAAWKVVYPNPKPSDRPAQQARFDARREFWPAAETPFGLLLDRTVRGRPVPDSLHEYAAELRHTAADFLRHRLDSLPDNAEGMKARARAEQRFHNDLAHPEAPAELRGETDI